MAIDTDILLWINRHHAVWADTLMWYCSAKPTWIPLYVLMLTMLWLSFSSAEPIRRRVGKGLVMLVVIAALVALTDQCCHILKYAIARPRPSHAPDLEGVLHLVRGYTGGMYGHPSSHAADTMAVATFFMGYIHGTWCFRRGYMKSAIALTMTLYVGLNCYSRMYLGVHYPGDILFGLLIGAAWGSAAYVALRRLYAVWDRSGGSQTGCTDPPSESA